MSQFTNYLEDYRAKKFPPKAPQGSSRVEKEWLHKLRDMFNISIQEQYKSPAKGLGRLRFDGYTDNFQGYGKTCFEFLGCMWHGCPHCYPERKAELDKTYSRLRKVKEADYRVLYIWECEWKKFKEQDVFSGGGNPWSSL